MKKKTITQEDIARALNLSRITVSKALNGTGQVNKKTKDCIISTAREMGYHLFVAEPEKHVKKNEKLRIVSLFFDTNNKSTYWSRIIYGLSAALSKKQINNEILFLASNNGETKLPDILFDNTIDGLLTFGTMPEFFFEHFSEYHFPVSMIDIRLSYIGKIKTDVILSENQYAYSAIADILCQKGFRKFAYIGPETVVKSSFDRFNGFVEGMKKNHIKLNSSLVTTHGQDDHFSKEDICRAIDRFDEEPEVIFCANDLIASIIISLSKQNYPHINPNITLVGYDYSPEFRNIYPNLYNVDCFPEELAKAAVDNLLLRIKNPSNPTRFVQVMPKLIVPKY